MFALSGTGINGRASRSSGIKKVESSPASPSVSAHPEFSLVFKTTFGEFSFPDSEGNKKKLKVKVKEVLNLSGEDRIVVNFDYLDCPFGEAQPLLSGFCGILVVDSSLFPMHFDKWPNMPMSYFDRVFDQIIVLHDDMFIIVFQRSGVQIGWTYGKCSVIHLRAKLRLWIMFHLEFQEISGLLNVNYRYKKKHRKMCNRNAENRKKQIIPHTTGSKANSRRRGEMEKIQQTLSQSTVDESIISPDAVGKVLGKEHSGRVRCLGLGVVPTRVFKQERPRFSGMNASSVSCPSNCQDNYNKLLNSHNQMMAAFKSYMIMKEGTLPEQFVGLFAPPPTMTPQHPNKTKLREQNNRVLRNARRLTTDSGMLNWINGVQDADPGYLCLHRHKMQANWHQYMECTSMRAGKLSNKG
ncbi:hypothetical protein KY284_027120 [Solanum tuberosum]|nr:hypothetical protein KY284_027120 [Solanum tuberosum]